jgi:hypothetical protein
MSLIAFGDSFTYGYDLSDCNGTQHSNLTYSALTAGALNIDYRCHATGSFANNAITRTIIEADLHPSDIVLVMWTYPIRREFLLNDLGYISVNPLHDHGFTKHYYKHLDTDNIGYLINESLKEIYIAQQILKEKQISYVFLSAVTDLSHYLTAQDCKLARGIDLSSWLFLDNNLGFMPWSKSVLNLQFVGHPPDAAHRELSSRILAKLNAK